jgi:predicted XRE-type DNA-binding protein
MTKEKITSGSRNVFADLGYPDAAERQTKVRLAVALNRLLANRRLKQADAAKALGVPQPKISALANYHLTGFSVERLMQFITSLDHDVEIRIRPRKARSGGGQIVVSEAR